MACERHPELGRPCKRPELCDLTACPHRARSRMHLRCVPITPGIGVRYCAYGEGCYSECEYSWDKSDVRASEAACEELVQWRVDVAEAAAKRMCCSCGERPVHPTLKVYDQCAQCWNAGMEVWEHEHDAFAMTGPTLVKGGTSWR